MEKCSPSHGQNGQLVHWWVLVHFGHTFLPSKHVGKLSIFGLGFTQNVIPWLSTFFPFQ
jgi:hypothetical protein